MRRYRRRENEKKNVNVPSNGEERDAKREERKIEGGKKRKKYSSSGIIYILYVYIAVPIYRTNLYIPFVLAPFHRFSHICVSV